MRFPSWQIALVLLLWAAPLAACAVPRLASSLSGLWRTRDDLSVTLFILAALAAAVYAFPSSASKGGTNEPPAQPSAPAGRINLYYIDADGRMVPLDAEIRSAP